MPTITHDGVPLAFRWGGAGRDVLVLSHSLGASGAMWQAQLGEFGKRFRLLLPDHRGHGQSGVPPGPYCLAQIGEELIALLDHLQLDRVRFCGLSLGGMIGMWLGHRAPERIEQLVLCNTAAKIIDTTLLRRREELLRREGMSAIADNVMDRWFTRDFRDSRPAQVQAARQMLLATSPAGYAHTSRAVRDLDLRNSLASISCPTLVIGGEYDLATPLEWSEAIASAIPEARLSVLQAAHLSNIEARDDFNRIVIDFLARD